MIGSTEKQGMKNEMCFLSFSYINATIFKIFTISFYSDEEGRVFENGQGKLKSILYCAYIFIAGLRASQMKGMKYFVD